MSRTRVVELPFGNVPAAQAVVNQLKLLSGEKHTLFSEVRVYVFQGARSWVMYRGNDPISLHVTKIGKRKKNVWEPVANWYAAYTLPEERRRGHAYRLYVEMEGVALRAGCRHVKSLAGSSAGLGLHNALHHRCWGTVPTGEVFVYSPLPGSEHIYPIGAAPPGAPLLKKLSYAEINALIKQGLRYDITP
jgi:hypothetical protein